MSNFKEDLRKIEAFVFDFDGVFTDGSLYIFPDGEQVRSMNIKDGYAVQFAIKKDFPIAIISGASCGFVVNRFKGLGVNDIYLHSRNKMNDLNDFIEKRKLNPDNILFMGDDLPDYEVMKYVGVSTCPADAAIEIKSISKYISNYDGGKGCVRDVIEQVLRAQKKWADVDAFHW
ncbi:MAG: 3-deoxy-D-manno-octulosonate 8-phosphate phosphatase [Bacteroidetes bacterium]|nr:MAG: 3-deoxy-D-manno-octulosonate 8-phosphate phosphatase [Bacteroidota bacterium]